MGGKWGRPSMFRFKRKKKKTKKTPQANKIPNAKWPVFHFWESYIYYLKNILYFNFIVLASWHLEHLIYWDLRYFAHMWYLCLGTLTFLQSGFEYHPKYFPIVGSICIVSYGRDNFATLLTLTTCVLSMMQHHVMSKALL